MQIDIESRRRNEIMNLSHWLRQDDEIERGQFQSTF